MSVPECSGVMQIRAYLLIIFLFIFLGAGHCFAQDSFPLIINNSSEYNDNQLYIAIIGEDLNSPTKNYVWLDPINSSLNPMNKSFNTVPGPVYNGNTNPGGQGLYADCFTRLSNIPGKTIMLPPLKGCRIFISALDQLYLFFHGASGTPSGYTAPSKTDPDDPNQGIRHEVIEITYDQYGVFANTTRVDSYQAPIGLELYGLDGYYKRVGEMASHEKIINSYKDSVPEEFRSCIDIENQEILAPGKCANFADGSIPSMPTGPYSNYMQSYVNQVWQKYRSEDLLFNAGDAGIWQGRVSGESFVFSCIRGGFQNRKAVIIRQPSTQEVFEGKGVLDNIVQDGTADLLVQAQFTAALNRHVIFTGPEISGLQDWSDPETYYRLNPCNHYAKFWHQQGISIQNLSYGFPYDDVWEQSSSVHTPEPEKLIITFGSFPGESSVETELPEQEKTRKASGISTNGDYSFLFDNVQDGINITFLQERPEIGDNIVILYYSTSPSGVYPGYIVQPG
jgi:hypothetical protein